MIIMGFHSVAAALSADFPIKVIHANRKGARVAELMEMAKGRDLSWREYGPKDEARFEAEFKRLGGNKEDFHSCQGVFAEGPEPQPVGHLELLERAKAKEPFPILLYLDQVTDPQNLGSILRSAAFFGVSGIVLTETRSSPLTPAAIKISSGGFAVVPIARVTNLVSALEDAKEAGFWIAGLSEHAKESFDSARFDVPLALVIGNEELGMRSLTEKTCDFLLRLPAEGPLISLNAGTAAAVALALARRQQGEASDNDESE
jgi:23S rRNA (guanosine2251-2'-O)-methyltransferase